MYCFCPDNKFNIISIPKCGCTQSEGGFTKCYSQMLCNDHFTLTKQNNSVALVVIDCQPVYYDFNPTIKENFPELPRKVSNILSIARQRLSPEQIIHVRANYTLKFAQNFDRLNPDKLLPNDVHACSWAASNIGEEIIVKGSFDAFHDTNLESYLRETGIDTIVVCGLVTSVCVLFSTQSAFARGFKVLIYEEGCGDRCIERHKSAISLYDNYCFEVYNDCDTIFDLKS
jgi:nicotinamidase-related amidase